MIQIEENLTRILEKIKIASGNRSNVKLIAVSKTKPVELILRAFQAGQLTFGENRVQEARDKSRQLPSEIDWHLIGPLQKNKAKYCPSIFSTIHTIHNTDVADVLNQKCLAANRVMTILVQMNLTGEDTKSGVTNLDDLKRLNDHLLTLPGLKLTGLMTIGDPDASNAANQKVFARLHEILIHESSRLGLQTQMTELSVGMSDDYEIALQEGATFIRIGSAIFGER